MSTSTSTGTSTATSASHDSISDVPNILNPVDQTIAQLITQLHRHFQIKQLMWNLCF
jgi:hypothetical protein